MCVLCNKTNLSVNVKSTDAGDKMTVDVQVVPVRQENHNVVINRHGTSQL